MKRPVLRVMPLAIAAIVLAAGCAEHPAKPATQTSDTTRVEPSSRSAGSADTRTSTSTSTSTAASTTQAQPARSGSTGIPACDDYLASYKGCHRAAGIYSPDTIDTHYREMRDTLLEESRDPDKRPLLAQRCVSLANLLKQALHGKACEPAQPANAGSVGEP